ncbi:MAG: FtsQ-type POTRA domain-containing protein [Acidobacteria bacterium]|nr:FtsQ-type POTRA domain-containing protein [Acidobacteriota bacterium]
MKIKTTLNREVGGKEAPPDKKRARRKPASNRKPRLSARSRIAAAFRFLGKVFVPALLTFFVLISGIFALSSDAFELRDIRISGCRHQDAGTLEGIIRGEFPANVLRIDLDKARLRLEKETWVKRVEVHRVLPSSLVLRIEEREPTVLLELGGAQMMADGEGVLLGTYKREFGKIDSPIFRGLAGKDPKTYEKYYTENAGRIRNGVAMLAEIAAEMPQDVRNISEIDLSELNNIKIMMDNDQVEICLGSENYLKRFSGFVGDPAKKYQELKNQGIQVAQIDLSNDGQIVYKNLEAVAREKTLKLNRSVNR